MTLPPVAPARPRSRRAALAAAAACVGALVGPPRALGAQAPLAPVPPAMDADVRAFLAAPFTDQLTAAAEGRAVAWVTNTAGRRAVRVAVPDADGRWTARTLWAAESDDGQEIGALSLSRDGRVAVWVRGGAPNRAGELPNPTSDPRGVERAIWIAPVTGGSARRLLAGASPQLSPDGRTLAYVVAGALHVQALRGDSLAGTAPTRIAMRGAPSEVSWSPDGTRLAFASGRGTHAFVGTYELSTQRIGWLDPSTDVDLAPTWSPDGTRLAWVRTPSQPVETPNFVPQRRADVPWSLRVAEVATGRVVHVFRADTGRGSAWSTFEGRTTLAWTGDGRGVVVPWEKDGWLRPWLVPVGAGAPRALTRCACEASWASVRRAGGRDELLVTLNADTTLAGTPPERDRYRAWAIDMVSGVARALDSTDAGSIAPVAVGRDAYASIRLGWDVPGMVQLHDASGTRAVDGQPLPSEFERIRARLVRPQAVMLRAADGVTTYGQLFLPPASVTTRRPGVVFIHGGSRRQMLATWHNLSYYHATYAYDQWLASQGYVVLALNYRSGTGYGLDFREARDYGATGASEYRDVEAAGRWLARHPRVDSTRLGIYGGSYGGYLTAHALGRDSRNWKVGVDIHGVHDWNVGIANFVPAYDSLRQPAFGRTAYASSPLAHVAGWRSPVLLVHGDDDRNVKFVETQMLLNRLRVQGVHTELLVLPDEVHGFLRTDSWARAFAQGGEFLGRYLRPDR
jgi:dipeptidyl aminopeptidase/acylaminoacyl peptidase